MTKVSTIEYRPSKPVHVTLSQMPWGIRLEMDGESVIEIMDADGSKKPILVICTDARLKLTTVPYSKEQLNKMVVVSDDVMSI